MNLVTVDKVYSGEKLKVPMVIDVDTATWVNNKIRPTKGTMYEKGYYYWTVVLDSGKKKHIINLYSNLTDGTEYIMIGIRL